MESTPALSAETRSMIDQIHQLLTTAQALMDEINPNSIFGARIQHLIDDLEQQTENDLNRPAKGRSVDELDW